MLLLLLLLLLFVPRPDATYLQSFLFVTVANGASAFFVCVCACHPEHNFGLAERCHATLPPDFKSTHPRAAHQAAVRHHHRTSHRLIHGSACVSPLQRATPPRCQVYRIPKRNLVHITIWPYYPSRRTAPPRPHRGGLVG